MLRYTTKLDLVQSPCTTSGQETERVYSYNPGARTGQAQQKCSQQVLHNRLAMPPICGLISALCSDTGNAEKNDLFLSAVRSSAKNCRLSFWSYSRYHCFKLIPHSPNGWLEFDSTFSTNRLHCSIQKNIILLNTFVFDR